MSPEIVIFYLEEQDRFLYYIFDGKLNLLEDFDSKKYEDFKKSLYLIYIIFMYDVFNGKSIKKHCDKTREKRINLFFKPLCQ